MFISYHGVILKNVQDAILLTKTNIKYLRRTLNLPTQLITFK